MAIYTGIGGSAKSVSKIYIGVGGTARQVHKGYIGVDGVAKKFYDGGNPISSFVHWGLILALQTRAATPTGIRWSTRAFRAADCTTARPTVHGSGEQALRHPLPSVAVTSTATKGGHWTTGVSTTRVEISSPVWQTA